MAGPEIASLPFSGGSGPTLWDPAVLADEEIVSPPCPWIEIRSLYRTALARGSPPSFHRVTCALPVPRIRYIYYSCFARGIDALNGTYHFLELTPRAETKTDSSCLRTGFGTTIDTKADGGGLSVAPPTPPLGGCEGGGPHQMRGSWSSFLVEGS
jgi:hypothetical protein